MADVISPDDALSEAMSVFGGRVGLSPVMVGRQAALGRLRQLATEPGFALVLLNGEAGIGKTRLLRELGLVTDRPMLAGQADPTTISRPLGLVGDLLGTPVTDPSHTLALLEERLARGPAVVAFEDLHWADAASVEVFERLADRRLPGLLLIGTYRPEDLSRRLPGGDTLARMERRHDIERLHLDRLDRGEVAAFLAIVSPSPLPAPVADALYERTGGNPFFLEELARACRELPPDRLADQPLPWSLEEVVRRQLDGLSHEQRRLAEAAAILGRAATFDVLAGVAELDETALLLQLRALVDSGLLIEHHPDQFVFRHALVADAVLKHLLGRERRRLHERALVLVAASENPSRVELARHAAGAGRFEEMVEHARAAAVMELRQRGTSHLALRLATEALSESPDDPVLLEVATEAAWLLGLLEEGIATAAHLHDVAKGTGSLPSMVTAVKWLARLHYDQDNDESSEQWTRRLEELLDEPLEPIDRARTLGALAQITMLRAQAAQAIDWADQAVAEAEAVGAVEVTAQALVERGSARIELDPSSAAELEAAADRAADLGLWVLVTRALNNLFGAVPVHSLAGQQLLARFHDAAERAGFDSMTSVVYFVRLVDLGFGLGDLDMVRDAMARAQERLPLHRDPEAGWILQTRRAQLQLEHGDATGVHAGPPMGVSPGCLHHDDLQYRQTTLDLMAAALDRDGEAARRTVAELADLPVPRDPGVLLDAVEAAVSARVPTAEVRRLFPPLPADASGHVGEAFIAQAEHRHADAADVLRAALESPDPSLPRPTLGSLYTRLAVSELALGHRAAARTAVSAAEATLAGWGGRRCDAAAEVRRRIEASGSPSAAGSDGTTPSLLTGREREVAALVAEGLSNGLIAQRLFISPKTASVHVSNILMKLGLANRAEIAAWTVRSQVGAPIDP